MADMQTNINVNIDVSNALANLKNLQREISAVQSSLARGSASQVAAARNLQQEFVNSINATGKFSATFQRVESTTERFTRSLEKNKFSLGEYFKYAGGASKTFGRFFTTEMATVDKVARERVKSLQTQYVKLGRDATGAIQSIAIRPLVLDMNNLETRTAIAAQKQQIFNQLLKQGSTNLLNFGKNTQWAGRQLMVGFTIPLSIFGTTAAKSFMELEEQAIKFKKVYGDLFTAPVERQEALAAIQELGKEFTKYGVSVADTIGLAADAAAAGFKGIDLQRQTTEATRLSILGQIDQQKALETTISLQNAFAMSSADLADSINFLNAVENQTVVSLDDITTAIPKVAPVIQQLGGDVKDLTFFLAAMKEGGINASEGANALKSGLAALINPTEKASQMLGSFGINIRGIVERNAGDLKQTVIDFALALDKLDPLQRAQAIEQLFGKFQFARLSTLFANVIRDGNQASRVLELASASAADLAQSASQELGVSSASAMNQFRAAVENLQLALAPLGELFLKTVTPLINFATDVLNNFNKMDSGIKTFVVNIVGLIGGIGPIALMTFGLLANGVANIIKLFTTVRGIFNKTGDSSIMLGEQIDYMTQQQLDAAAVAASLDQIHQKLTQRFTVEKDAVIALTNEYVRMNQAGATRFPAVAAAAKSKKLASGIVSVPGPKGAGDIVPAMLSPGEAVIPADMAQKYAPLIQGMVSDNIPGFVLGNVSVGNGQTVDLDFRSKKAEAAIQKAINGLVGGLDNGIDLVIETLARLADETQVSAREFMQELEIVATDVAGMQTGAATKAATGKSIELKAGAAGVKGKVSENLAEAFGTVEIDGKLVNPEFERAKAAAIAGEQALREFLLGLGKSEDNITKQLKQALEVHRAHIVEVSALQKQFGEGWDPRLWVAQASFENQLSNILDRSTETRNLYTKYLMELGDDVVSEEQRRSIIHKINNNLALTDQELQIQAIVLQRILSSTDAISLAAQTTESFPAFATATVAGARARAAMGPAPVGVGSRTAEQQAEAQAALENAIYGKIAQGTALTEAGVRLGAVIEEKVADGVDQAAQSSSPSKKIKKSSKNMVDAVDTTIIEAKGDVKKATKQGIVAPVTQALLDKSGRNIATTAGFVAAPLVTNVGNAETSARTNSMDIFMSSISKASFGLSALAGITSMFGGAVGEVSSVLFGLSSAIFGLTMVTELLAKTQLAKLVSDRADLVASRMGAASWGALFTKGQGLSGMFGNLVKGIGAFLRFLGPVGIGLSLLAIGIPFVVNAIEEHRKKLLGLAVVSGMATEKIQKFGDIVGAQTQKSPFDVITTLPKPGEVGVSAQRQISAQQAIEDFGGMEEFKAQYQTEIQAIVNGTEESIQAALSALAIRLFGAGWAEDQIRAMIDALQIAAGGVKVDLNFEELNFMPDGEFDVTTIQNAAKKQAEAYQTAYDAEARRLKGVGAGATIPEEGIRLGTTTIAKSTTDIQAFIQQTKADIAQQMALAGIGTQEEARKDPAFTGLFNDLEQAQNQLAFYTGTVEVNSEKVKTAMTEAMTNAASVIDGLGTAFDSGNISLEDFRAGIAAALFPLDSIADKIAATDILMKELGFGDDIIAEITDIDARLAMIDAKAAGINLNEFINSYLNAGTDKERLEIINDLIKATKKHIDQKEEENKLDAQKEEYNAIMAAANEGLDKEIETLQNQNIAYEILIANGFSAAEAILAVNDANFAAALANNANTASLGPLIDKYREVLALRAASPIKTSGGGGGGGRKSDYQQAIDKLKEERKEIANNLTAYSRLRDAGFDIAQAFTIAKDPILAAALATTKVGTAAWEKLLSLIKQTNAELQQQEIYNLLQERQMEIELGASFLQIAPTLAGMGLALADIEEIMSNPALAAAFVADLQDGKVDAQEMLIYLQQIEAMKQIEINLRLSTEEGVQDQFRELYDMAMNMVDAYERQVEDSFEDVIRGLETQMKAVEKTIATIQEDIADRQREIELSFNRPIAALQEQSSDLANDLAIIDNTTAEINKRYDEQQKALEQVSKINEKLIAQDQTRLTIADALTQGNIADAAKAIQDFRGQQAQDQASTQQELLNTARQSEIDALRSERGMTREEIAQRQFEISQQIYKLEEQRELKLQDIQKLEDEIYNLQDGRLEQLQAELDRQNELKDAELEKIRLQREAWEDALLAADMARINSEEYRKVLEMTAFLMEGMQKTWDQIKSKTIELYIREVVIPAGAPIPPAGGGGGGGSNGDTTTQTEYDRLLPDVAKLANDIRSAKQILTNLISTNPSLITLNARVNAINGIIATYNAKAADLIRAAAASGQTSAYRPMAKMPLFGPGGSAPGLAMSAGGIVPNYMRMGGVVKPAYMRMGGLLPYKAEGGMFRSLGTDTVPTMLTPGEFVVRRHAVRSFGVDKLKAINSGTYSDSSVYNYSVSVNVQTEADPNQIARAVMGQIRQIDSMRIRGNRF